MYINKMKMLYVRVSKLRERGRQKERERLREGESE